MAGFKDGHCDHNGFYGQTILIEFLHQLLFLVRSNVRVECGDCDFERIHVLVEKSSIVSSILFIAVTSGYV